MGGVTRLLMVSAIVGLLAQTGSCRPSVWEEALERKELRRLLDLLNPKNSKRENVKTTASKRHNEGEFRLPDDFFFGGEEYLAREDDGKGHGHDVIDKNVDLDSPENALFASFEVMANGEIKKPDVDLKDTHVQEAQNHDHHKYPGGKRGVYNTQNFIEDSRRWENGIIPYEIDTNTITNVEKQEMIREAIQEVNDLTCLKIVPMNIAPTVSHNSYLWFTDNSDGCWSFVGRKEGKQEIGLEGNEDGEADCYDKSTILHEILHAIGMEHEQQRFDRDKHVTMVWPNIKDGKENYNMIKESTNDKNSFDLESVLMYGLYSFAIVTENKTMLVKDERLAFLPNTAHGLTFYDVKDITVEYNCTMNCPNSTSPACTNTGFLGWTCQCVCPPGLKGEVCEIVDSDEDCGGIINLASGESRNIQSPNYPNNYPVDKSCVWLIKGPTKSKIKLTVLDLEMRNNDDYTRCYHWLEIRYNLIGQTGIKECGSGYKDTIETTDTEINGRHNYMMLRFDSRFSKDVPADKGFKVKVEAIGGGTNCTNATADPCSSNPCKNGGVCSKNDGSFTCQCSGEWKGSTCEHKSSDELVCTFEPSTNCFLENNYTPKQASNPPYAVSGSYYISPNISEQFITLMIDPTKVTLTDGQQYCLGFSYFIQGSNPVIVIFSESDINYENPLKMWTGDTDWKAADYNFTAASNNNPALDIYLTSGAAAVDDVTLKEGSCNTTSHPCDNVPCKNGGTCTNSGTSFTCQCTSAWTGPNCEIASSSSTCTFESSTACFLNKGYNRVRASAQTIPNSANNGNYFVQPDKGVGYLTLSMNKNRARLVVGKQYCLRFSYTITGNHVEVGIYEESDKSFKNPKQILRNTTPWTDVGYSFIASKSDNPVIDMWHIGSGTAAVDDVSINSGQC